MYGNTNSVIALLFLIVFIFFESSTSYVISRNTREVESDSDDTSNSGLYYGFTKVTILNSTNFKKEIFEEQKQKLWLVEFYNHWCGYCMRFVPVMKAFATDVYEWRDLIGIGTVDCAHDMNNEICRNHEINKVPSLKIFPPKSNENFVGLEFGHGSETTITHMRENLAQILKSYHNSQEKINGSVNLKLLTHHDLDILWKEFPKTVIYLMLVFEPKDSLIGSQVALDISQTPVIGVRLVDPKNQNLTKLVNMEEGLPGAVILERRFNLTLNLQPSITSQITTTDTLTEMNDLTKINLNEGDIKETEIKILISELPNNIHQSLYVTPVDAFHLTIENFTREGLNKAVRGYLIDQGVDIAPELPKVPIIYTNVSVDEIKEAVKREEILKKTLNVSDISTVIFQMDLETAISYAMTKEVTLQRNITGEQLSALRDFMEVIIKYFPTGEQGKRFFKELKDRELNNKDSVCGEDLRKTFEELEQNYKPFMPNLEWVGCRGTIPSLRGYPCSLWTMFHTLVAVEEIKDRNIPDEKPEVLNAMAGYIKNFFSCSQCAEHFSQMAKTIAGNVTSQRDAVMWLWKAHNNVNRRLAGDITEDARHQKVQFPKKDACPSCYASDGSWDESKVFFFISSMVTNISPFNPADLPSISNTTTTTPLPTTTL